MKILCVTKCPTGMVQTYVAAEKLEQAGKKLGIDLSVETQGAMGIQNQFSPEQIDEADYIVIAADVAIDEASRFGNKKLYVTSLEDAIVHHMWPMTLHMPKTKEGWLLQAVDKYCALSEIILQGSRKVRYSRAAVSFLTSCSFATQIWK